MCAAAVPISVLFAIFFVNMLSLTIMSRNHLYTEGLPINKRQERGMKDEDILAGNEFLSVFLESSASYQQHHRGETARDRIATKTTMKKDKEPEVEQETHIVSEPYVRSTRKVIRKNDVPLAAEQYLINSNTSDNNNNGNNGVVIGVHVSSSVGSKIIVNNNNNNSAANFYNTNTNNFYNIIAKSSNSELNIDEPEPITISNNNNGANEDEHFQSIPNFSPISSSSAASSEFSSGRSSLPPYHHSFIYHDDDNNGEGATDRKQPGKTRSVSYSTIIQAIPSVPVDNRKERNYNAAVTNYNNNRNNYQNNVKLTSTTTMLGSSTTTTPIITTTRSNPSIATTSRPIENRGGYHLTTSKYPVVLYGSPEKNYEVDEAVSVVTNGRAHGIQSSQKKKSDKDQKFGYVVEGRNYRQYRVEERTPDGFIVGEYGVVSHDDGSLRGVRYTADGTINPRLIQDALMKFLSL